MILSCLPVSFFPDIISGAMSIGDWARCACNLGFDGFDISSMFVKNHTACEIDSILIDVSNIGCIPVMLTTYPDFSNPDSKEIKRQLDYLMRDIALADKLGFRYVRITAGQNHKGIDFDKTVDQVVDCFLTTAEHARHYSPKLVFENHAKPGAWPLVDFSFDPKAFLAIASRLKGTPVKINFDTANAKACGSDPASLLSEVIGEVETIHINDTSTIGHLSAVLIGTGLVDFESVFSVLKKFNFNGTLCIEEASCQGIDGIKKAYQYLQKFL